MLLRKQNATDIPSEYMYFRVERVERGADLDERQQQIYRCSYLYPQFANILINQ